MKLAIGTCLIPAATLILPGCAQLLQGRFTAGLRHVAAAVLLSNLAFVLPFPWGGLLASMLWLALGGWSAFDAPGSEERIENWAFFIGISLPPVLAIVLCAVAWGLYRRGRPWWAMAMLAGVVLAGLLAFTAILRPDAFQ